MRGGPVWARCECRHPRMRCAGLGLRSGLGPDRNHGGADMAQAKTWVGLDVHVWRTVAAVLDGESGELRRRRLSGRTDEIAAFVAGLEGPVRVTYEVGPTGFALARRLTRAGVGCVVCAPGLVPRGPSDRVKTDQRDAERLVRLLAVGELHAVAMPSVEEEAMRDLVRAREALRGDLMRARHRLSKLLLRHDVRFDATARNLDGRAAALARPRAVRAAGDPARIRGLSRRRRGRGNPARRARGRDRPAAARRAVG